VVRGISYGLFGPPGEFGPQARALGAGLVRAYLYWSQVEPAPGQYRWDTVDALLGELDDDTELWITLCSSSPWGTRQPTDFLPPSPALDQGAYARFVRQVVRHCGGRVRYWQCDNEPSNTGLLWAGTAAEYVEQLTTMYAAVKEADPAAAVVLGGCGYDVFGSEPGSAPRQFFEYVAKAGRDAFDLFSVHLYGDLDRIPEYIATARQFMRAHGYLKPVLAGEHAGPQPFEFPEAMAVMQETFAAAFAAPAEPEPGPEPLPMGTGELAARAGQETPERRAMTALYNRMDTLPPRLQMFMAGCPAGLEARRERIGCRQVVTRTVLALAEGVRRTAYWNLAPEYPGPVDHLQMMHLLIGKLPLLGYRDGELSLRHPAADTFALLAWALAGARTVSRITPEGPEGQQGTLRAFEADRAGRGPLLVLWDQRDPFDGEDQPPLTVTWPWPAAAAAVTDAFGRSWTVPARDGGLRLAVTDTPLLIEASLEPPEGTGQADAAQVLRGLRGLAPHVPAVKPSVVPVGSEPPQRTEVHDVAAGQAGRRQPGVHALRGAEQALMAAGVHYVIPHLRGGHQEVGDLVPVRRAVAPDVPRVRPAARRAPGRDQHLVLAGQQVGEREGVPGAAAPPQGPGSHHREAERHGRERMRHHDPAVAVQRQVPGPGQARQAVSHLGNPGTEPGRQRARIRCAPGRGELLVHRQPQVLAVHTAILAKPGENRPRRESSRSHVFPRADHAPDGRKAIHRGRRASCTPCSRSSTWSPTRSRTSRTSAAGSPGAGACVRPAPSRGSTAPGLRGTATRRLRPAPTSTRARPDPGTLGAWGRTSSRWSARPPPASPAWPSNWPAPSTARS
jgi:hypothetical protein